MPNARSNGHAITNPHSNGNINGNANGKIDDRHAEELNLSILGIGVEYPPYKIGPEALQSLAERHYPKSPAYVNSSSTTTYFLIPNLFSCWRHIPIS